MIPRRSAEQVRIKALSAAGAEEREDSVAVEEPLEIRISFVENGQRLTQGIAVTMRTPGQDYELAAGFLFSEGVIKSGADIHQITYCTGPEKQEYNLLSVSLREHVAVDHARLTRHVFTTSSCGVCGKASLDALRVQGAPAIAKGVPVVSRAVIGGLSETLRKEQSAFEKTGGLHAAGLFDASGKLIVLSEDVGRHNAVDKVIGAQVLQKQTPLAQQILMVSGRTSFEILQKALMAGIPVVAAVGAPSSLAVSLARDFGMTLVGFLRDGRFNIYSSADRVS
jgi:FdhD protein